MNRKFEKAVARDPDMTLRFNLLKSIYLACKTQQLQRISGHTGTVYYVSFKDGILIVSSGREGEIPDDSLKRFLELRIGEATGSFAQVSSRDDKVIVFYMTWEHFDIDKFP